MEIALDLARKCSGFTFPNPTVGCVIVEYDKIKKDHKIISGSSDRNREDKWTLNGNNFCQIDEDDFEMCGSIKLDGNQLEWKKTYYNYVYKKMDQ